MGMDDEGHIEDETRETCDLTEKRVDCDEYGEHDYTCGQYYYFVKVAINDETHTLCNVERSCGTYINDIVYCIWLQLSL